MEMVQIEIVYNYKSKQKKCDQICVKIKKVCKSKEMLMLSAVTAPLKEKYNKSCPCLSINQLSRGDIYVVNFKAT